MKYKRRYEKRTTLADWKDYTAKEIHRQSIPTANTMSNGTARLLTPSAQQETPSPPPRPVYIEVNGEEVNVSPEALLLFGVPSIVNPNRPISLPPQPKPPVVAGNAPAPTAATPAITQSQGKRKHITQAHCSECKRKKSNQQCAHSRCAECCGLLDQHCHPATHNNAKFARISEERKYQLINNAMIGRHAVQIQYNGPYSTRAGQYRAVQPTDWHDKKAGFAFQGVCADTASEKTYHYCHVMDVQAADFVPLA